MNCSCISWRGRSRGYSLELQSEGVVTLTTTHGRGPTKAHISRRDIPDIIHWLKRFEE